MSLFAKCHLSLNVTYSLACFSHIDPRFIPCHISSPLFSPPLLYSPHFSSHIIKYHTMSALPIIHLTYTAPSHLFSPLPYITSRTPYYRSHTSSLSYLHHLSSSLHLTSPHLSNTSSSHLFSHLFTLHLFSLHLFSLHLTPSRRIHFSPLTTRESRPTGISLYSKLLIILLGHKLYAKLVPLPHPFVYNIQCTLYTVH